ncbi:hypothetical protein GCM10011369_08020 [Neiella marina]|uniref:Uncharacterized protein n=1 Tax=Neiella marina TaxID=508461 RepID=A0A8J2U339_9GAMM|nr:hypothetical protein [Neiella marina]GGA68805.1 hypothetical protein GCM10011369_08020 [Neiella marina]
MKDRPNAKQLNKTLEAFEAQIQESCLPKPLSKELIYLANKAQSALKKADYCDADNSMAVAMQTIKRNLGSNISLRLGFKLSDTILANIRPYTAADVGVLAMDSGEFAERFFQIYADDPYRPPGLPSYMEKRPFPEDVQAAAESVLDLISSFELPEEQFAILHQDVGNFVMEANNYCANTNKADVLFTQDLLLTTIYFNLLDMQGSYLTQHQVMSVMGLIIFAAPPAWLCWSPPAILAQIALVVLGTIVYGIYKGLRWAATRKAYQGAWTFVRTCKVTVAQAVADINRRVAGLDAAQTKEVKDALKKTRKGIRKGTIVTIGNRAKVLQKLNAMIAAI